MMFTFSSSSPLLINRKHCYCFSPFLFTSVPFIILAAATIFYLGQDNIVNSSFCILDYSHQSNFTITHDTTPTIEKNDKEKLPPFAIGEGEKECDVFRGRWVRDRENRPLYEEDDCPIMMPQLACQKHGRPDKEYQYWRWQPHACSLPSFNSTLMLESLRDKKMMFVGDSLNGGQFYSMVCLLQRGIPLNAISIEGNETQGLFTAKDYNATIEFYAAPFLLEASKDKIVRKGSIDTHGQNWKGADIIVFNSYLWWMTGGDVKVLEGSFDDEKKNITILPKEEAYRMAMKSMLKWVKEKVNPKKTRVFFMSMSPLHGRSIEWGGDRNGNCHNETTPIEDPNYWSLSAIRSIMDVIREEFSKAKAPITFLNITQLSLYRKDAHTSIYKKQWHPLTKEQLAKGPISYADCIHWCSPGLQDTWNELLFTKLFYP